MLHTLLLLLLLTPHTARAQFDAATVLGLIKDESGATVPGATMTLTNLDTGIVATTVSDENGSYQILNVKVGRYSLKVELQGFTTAMLGAFDVTVNARQRVDMTLKVGRIGEQVQVTGVARLLESESSDRGQVISHEEIANLPLNGRAYADLALLTPGVRKSVLNGTAVSGARDASFNVNGLRSALNNFILDGVDNNAYGTSNQGFSNQVVQVSPDAVQEFKVQTNNYSAEFGRAAGAVINATLRSGTNQFRGGLWEFNRNTAFNAVGFFKPSSGVKPTLNRNQFGGLFGGPIVKDKSFFFLDYEGFRQIDRTVTFSSIPTMDLRAGVMGTPIKNPYTGALYADGIIPQSAITDFAKKVLAGIPAPTRSGLSNNFDALPRQQTYNDKFDVKYDQQVDASTTAFVRVSHRNVDNFEPPPIPGDVGSPGNSYVHVLNQQVAGGLTRTLSNSSLLEVRIGVSRTHGGKTPFGAGGPDMLDLYGITGLPTQAPIAGGTTQQSISGWTALGRQSSNPQYQNPFVVDARLNYSWILGRHSLKSGYEYQAIDTQIDDFHPKYGADSYSGQFSKPAGGTGPSAVYNLADFLMGARSTYDLINTFVANLRQRMHFGYLQDDWKVTPNLTLNVGVRYEFATPQWEADNHLTNFDPSNPVPNQLLQAKDGSLYDRSLVNPDRDNFAPRAGVAYTLNEKTVIRSAYGKSYIHFNRMGGENLLTFNGPHVVEVVISQTPSQGLCAAGQTPTTCFRPTQMGYPEGLNVPSSFSTLSARVNYIPRVLETGYVQAWHVTVQREVLSNLMVDVGYVGNKGDRLMILGDYNQARPNNPGEDLSLQARRPIPGYQWIQAAFDGGKSEYHALQIKVERRYQRGLYVLNAFTWSKAKDNASGHLEAFGGDNSRVNYRNLDGEWGTSGYDQPLNDTATVVWELPFGKDRRWARNMSPLLEGFVGGWRVTAISTMTSGLPSNLNYSPSSTFLVSTAPTYRPNLVGPLDPAQGQQTIDNWFNRDSVLIPTDRTQPFGNAPRNVGRGPAIYTLDMGLHKAIGLGVGQTRLELRVEAFNILNKTNFGSPNGNRSDTNFGTIRSLSTFPRQLQLGAKIDF